jgi:hypothetical protein
MLYQWLRQGGFVAKAFDTLIIVVLMVLMAFILIPESWAELGYWSVALILSGYLVPGLLEQLVKKAAHTFHLLSLLIALAGLALHAMLDGAVLTVGHGIANNNLSTWGRHDALDDGSTRFWTAYCICSARICRTGDSRGIFSL